MPAPRTIAAIDAGSNAIRAFIGAVTGPGEVIQLQNERIPVRLGHNAFTRSELDTATIDAAVAAFARFQKLFEYHGVQQYRAVATSATRSVRNRELLLHRIHYETGIDLEVIDGEEEIRLVRVAIDEAFGDRRRPDRLFDLGGGSMEVGASFGGDWRSVSLPIGTVRLMETFDLQGVVSPEEANMLRRYMRTVMDSHDTHAFGGGDATAIATGGNADALAELFGEVDSHGMATLNRSTLESALEGVLAMDISERMEAFGVREDRAEVMGIAGLAFLEVMEQTGTEQYVAPDVGVREGIAIELCAAVTEDVGTSLSPHSALLGAIRVFMARLGHDDAHGEHVRLNSVQLFDELQVVHGLSAHARVVLELAALLHDTGEVVNRKGHHRHTEYLVLNGRIPGLDDPLRTEVAALARAHRKSMPSKNKHIAYSKLSDEGREMIDRLLPLIRIADALDTDHRHLVHRIECKQEDDAIRVLLHVRENNGTSLATFSRRNHYFEKYYGIPLHMEIVE